MFCVVPRAKEALTPVLDATTVVELREAIQLTISRCVPNASLIKVFLRDPLTTHLVDENCRALPSSRFISDILQQRGKTEVTINHNQDSIRELLGTQYNNDGNTNSSVLLLPVPERGSHKKIGLIVVVSQAVSLSSVDPKRVNLCVKQISMSYEVIRASLNKDTSPNVASLLSLMQLCGELNDQDAAKLEIKVMRYLQEQTEAESGFLLLLVPETQMLFCQAVGDSVLQEEVRFAGPSSCFGIALETKQPITLDDIPLDRRQEVEKIIRRQIHSLLCVPVCINDSKDLLALACVVNKCNHQEFTETDADIIRQCFKYTATVLTSTLAFQNERKLKNQTQALLQVARKLFTRLAQAELEGGSQRPRTVDAINSYIQHRAESCDVPTNCCSPHTTQAMPCDQCSSLSCTRNLFGSLPPHQSYQCQRGAIDNTCVLVPMSTLHHLKDTEHLYGLYSAEAKEAWTSECTQESRRRTHASRLVNAVDRSSLDETEDQYMTPDSSPERCRTCNAQTQTYIGSGQEAVSSTHSKTVGKTNESQKHQAGRMRTSTPVTANAVPSLSHTSFGNTSNVRTLGPQKSDTLKLFSQKDLRNTFNVRSCTPTTNNSGSTPRALRNASRVKQKNPCSLPVNMKEPCHDPHDIETSKLANKFEKNLEWMEVLFENMDDFGNLFSAESFIDVGEQGSIAEARNLVTDMWHCMREFPLSSTDDPCLSFNLGLQNKSLHDMQMPPYCGRLSRKKSVDTSVASEASVHSQQSAIRKTFKEKTLHPKSEQCPLGYDSSKMFASKTDIVQSLHHKPNTGLKCHELNATNKPLTMVPDYSTTFYSNQKPHNAVDSLSASAAFCLVPYALSDSDSYYSLSDDDSSFASCGKVDGLYLSESCEAFATDSHRCAGKDEKNLNENLKVLGHLISPTKRDWLQPLWKCPEVRDTSPLSGNHSLFSCEDEADLQCFEDDEQADFYLAHQPEGEENTRNRGTAETDFAKTTLLFEELSNVTSKCELETDRAQDASMSLDEVKEESQARYHERFCEDMTFHTTEPFSSVEKVFVDPSSEKEIHGCSTGSHVKKRLDYSPSKLCAEEMSFQNSFSEIVGVCPELADVQREVLKAGQEELTLEAVGCIKEKGKSLCGFSEEKNAFNTSSKLFAEQKVCGKTWSYEDNSQTMYEIKCEHTTKAVPKVHYSAKKQLTDHASMAQCRGESYNIWMKLESDDMEEHNFHENLVETSTVWKKVKAFKEESNCVKGENINDPKPEKSVDMELDYEKDVTIVDEVNIQYSPSVSNIETTMSQDVQHFTVSSDLETSKETKVLYSGTTSDTSDIETTMSQDVLYCTGSSNLETTEEAKVLYSGTTSDTSDIETCMSQDVQYCTASSYLETSKDTKVLYSGLTSDIETTLSQDMHYCTASSDLETSKETNVLYSGTTSDTSDIETAMSQDVLYCTGSSNLETTEETKVPYSGSTSDTSDIGTCMSQDVQYCTGSSNLETTEETNVLGTSSDIETTMRQNVEHCTASSDLGATKETDILPYESASNIEATIRHGVHPYSGSTSDTSDIRTCMSQDVRYCTGSSNLETTEETNVLGTSSDIETTIRQDVEHCTASSDLGATKETNILPYESASNIEATIRHGVQYNRASPDPETRVENSLFYSTISVIETAIEAEMQPSTASSDLETTKEGVAYYHVIASNIENDALDNAEEPDVENVKKGYFHYSMHVSDIESMPERHEMVNKAGFDAKSISNDGSWFRTEFQGRENATEGITTRSPSGREVCSSGLEVGYVPSDGKFISEVPKTDEQC
ncbi:LOW QUALITY PROTEIN: phosphodiesterase [Elysia marginata]|uniref:Phosphodiesterase n=1 Tax=Elysia marginata TaxID=1093978 RepID=A0AAV4G3G2_9GAST|nr:LOW QUALITY PROTEIN: phosphodiesterase [Elysia marginata]